MQSYSTETIYQHALLSDVAYIDFTLQNLLVEETGAFNPQNAQIALVTGGTLLDQEGNPVEVDPRGFNEEQANRLAQRYRVIAHQENTSSGFSATLFLDQETQQQILSIRGTEGITAPSDLLADLFLSLGTGQTFGQFTDLKAFLSEIDAQGELADNFTIAGHSLGGHLATLLTLDETFSDRVEHAYTFNGAGLGLGAVTGAPLPFGLGGSAAVEALERLIEFAGFEVSNIPSDKITNLVSTAGGNFIAGSGLEFGTTLPVFTENQDGSIPFDGVRNHFMEFLVDGLSVVRILDRIESLDESFNPAAKFEEWNRILSATAPINPGNTLERIMEGIGNLFGIETTLHSEEQTDAFLDALDEKLVEQGIEVGSLTIKPANTSSNTLGFALNPDPDNIAYRYALSNLNAFVITGSPALYSAHNEEGALEIHNPETGRGQLTPAFLEQAATFLNLKSLLATEGDISDQSDTPIVYQARDEDGNVLEQLLVGESLQVPVPAKLVVFGSKADDSGNNALEGSVEADYLFGREGNDTLDGSRGTDYLEGGSGNDILHGVDPGGTADQQQDTLRGGAGMDTYHPGRNDIINDSDGKGRISLPNGTEISNHRFLREFGSDNIFVSADSDAIRVRLTSGSQDGLSTLTVLGAEQFTIEDFNRARHDFGIELPDASPDETGRPLTLGSEVDDTLGDLSGGDGDDEIRALAGDDRAFGGAGSDRIIGGDGDDILEGGDGNDQLSGDAGRDLLAGDAGNDNLHGGAGQDLISGQLGDDIASGGADNDLLAGGPGSDVLSGGDGNDLIVANIAAGAFGTGWSFTRNAPANPDNLRDPRNYFLDGIAVDVDAFNNPGLIDETAPNSLSIEVGTI